MSISVVLQISLTINILSFIAGLIFDKPYVFKMYNLTSFVTCDHAQGHCHNQGSTPNSSQVPF